VVLLWWAYQALLVKVQEGFDQIIQFLTTLVRLVAAKRRSLSTFEFSLVVPTILECYGRDEEQWEPILAAIFDIVDQEEFVGVLVKLLKNASSVFTLCATFRVFVHLVIPSIDITAYVSDLMTSARKIQTIVSKDPEHNAELYNAIIEFREGMKQYDQKPSPSKLEPPKQLAVVPAAKQEPVRSSVGHESIKAVAQKYEALEIPPGSPVSSRIPGKAHTKVSVCELTESFSEKLNEPELLVYRWIADLGSPDTHVVIQALKSISGQMKKDASVFEAHLDALVLCLIAKIHANFSAESPPVRLCKYSSFCLLTLFSEMNLKDKIRREFVRQIIYELLTHLSNGVSEGVLSQVLNAIIVKIMEDCPTSAFIGLLSALGEYSNYQRFSEKWIRLALKGFEACGTRICEVGTISEIVNSIVLVDQFFVSHTIEDIEASPLGLKIVSGLMGYVTGGGDSFGDQMKRKDLVGRMAHNSPLLGQLGL
jgi:hypothetical protein